METIGATFTCKNKKFTKQCGNEYSKLNSTEHIPMQGLKLILFLDHLCKGNKRGYTDFLFFNINFLNLFTSYFI